MMTHDVVEENRRGQRIARRLIVGNAVFWIVMMAVGVWAACR